MYCQKCGTQQSDEASFCHKCGAKLTQPEAPQRKLEHTANVSDKKSSVTTEAKASPQKKASRWSISLGEVELKKQVAGYKTLKFFETYRGISVGLILLSIAITTIFYFVGSVDVYTLIASILIYGIPAIFIYKGNRIALIIVMIFWTIDKGSQLIGVFSAATPSGFQGYIAIIWWFFYMKYFYGAYQIETARKKAA